MRSPELVGILRFASTSLGCHMRNARTAPSQFSGYDNPRFTTLPLIPARTKRTHHATRPGRHGVFCVTQTAADVHRLSPAFSAALSWRAPCHTHCAAQCSAASGGDMWVLVNLAMLVM